jgi:hypothetical protein
MGVVVSAPVDIMTGDIVIKEGTMDSSEQGRMSGLTEMAYEYLQEGTPDIGGWDVVTEDGAKLGEVHSLIGDPVAGRVRYIDVGLDTADPDTTTALHLLVPVGKAALDAREEKIVVRRVGTADIEKLPSYDHGAITREYEDSLRNVYEPSYNPATSIDDADYYEGALYDDTELYRAQGRV